MHDSGDKDRWLWGLLAVALVLFLGYAAILSTRLSREIDLGARSLGVYQLTETEKKAAEEARKREAAEALAALSRIKDYDAARWHPIHFKPAIETATNDQCLSCHSEILKHKVREVSPAGVRSQTALAWYQTLDTYSGDQQSFHARHLTSELSRQVMNLSCSFCHQGHDPREEAWGSSATTTAVSGGSVLRKQVDPQATCLQCHGRFPNEVMTGLDQPWHKMRETFETEPTTNGCLTCHAETFRTVRHQVSFLKPDGIEAASKTSSDTCYGCHGGRAWYRISYPYPRNPWPGMDKEIPDWAKSRPTASDPRYASGARR